MPLILASAASAAGYVFPNDLHVYWGLMIVLYPYITGIVAGAFIVSSLYHVFHVQSLRPVAQFSLLFALAFLVCAALPLLVHLGQPGRALSMFLTPNPSSAMAGFGYFYLAYAALLVLEIFFIYRPVLVLRQQAATGGRRLFYGVLAVGSDNLSAEALAMDRRIVGVLAGLGIPMACVLHGYVGFIFGGIKANPLWATPLMPVIFLLSACVSGIAGVIVAYVVLSKMTGRQPDRACLRTALRFLWGFFLVTFALEMLEIFSQAYMATSHWQTLRSLLWGPLFNSYWVWQVTVFSVIPLALLGYLSLQRVSATVFRVLAPLAAVMALLQVFLMRWNVVIGGQLISRSGRGAVYYDPGWLDREGILLSAVILLLPVAVLYGLGRILPLWPDAGEVSEGAPATGSLNLSSVESVKQDSGEEFA